MADPSCSAPAPGPPAEPWAGLSPAPSVPPVRPAGVPRWALPLGSTGVWVTLGMVACLVVAAAVAAWRPAEPISWAPLALVVGTALSTLAHEAAHAWVARELGYQVQGIVLGGLVGTTAYRGRGDRPLDRAAVALAGPAASAVLVLALLVARAVAPAGAAVAVEAGIALNAVAMVVNLVPLGGTDGAVFARALAQHRRSVRRSGGGSAAPRLAVPPTPAPTLVGDVPR